MLLKLDKNLNPIQVVGFNPDKTLKLTIPAGDSKVIDVSDDIFIKIVKASGSYTTEMNSDGNEVSLGEYYIGENFKNLKINNPDANNDLDLLIFRA